MGMSLIITIMIFAGTAENSTKPTCALSACPTHLEFQPNFPTQHLAWRTPVENKSLNFLRYTVWYRPNDSLYPRQWYHLLSCADLRTSTCEFSMEFYDQRFSVQAVYEECECNRSTATLTVSPSNITLYPAPAFNLSTTEDWIFINLSSYSLQMGRTTRNRCSDLSYQIQSKTDGDTVNEHLKWLETEPALTIKEACRPEYWNTCCIRMRVVCNEQNEQFYAFGTGNWSQWECIDFTAAAVHQLDTRSHDYIVTGLLLAVGACFIAVLSFAFYKGLHLYRKEFSKDHTIPDSLVATMRADCPMEINVLEEDDSKESYEMLVRSTNQSLHVNILSGEECLCFEGTAAAAVKKPTFEMSEKETCVDLTLCSSPSAMNDNLFLTFIACSSKNSRPLSTKSTASNIYAEKNAAVSKTKKCVSEECLHLQNNGAERTTTSSSGCSSLMLPPLAATYNSGSADRSAVKVLFSKPCLEDQHRCKNCRACCEDMPQKAFDSGISFPQHFFPSDQRAFCRKHRSRSFHGVSHFQPCFVSSHQTSLVGVDSGSGDIIFPTAQDQDVCCSSGNKLWRDHVQSESSNSDYVTHGEAQKIAATQIGNGRSQEKHHFRA